MAVICRIIFPLVRHVLKSLTACRYLVFKQIYGMNVKGNPNILCYVTVSISSDFQLFYKFSFIFIRHIHEWFSNEE